MKIAKQNVHQYRLKDIYFYKRRKRKCGLWWKTHYMANGKLKVKLDPPPRKKDYEFEKTKNIDKAG